MRGLWAIPWWMSSKPSQDRTSFFESLGLSEALPTIGLLPGSRAHELHEHVPPMVGCAAIINRQLGGAQFVIGASGAVGTDSLIRRQVDSAMASTPDAPAIKIAEGQHLRVHGLQRFINSKIRDCNPGSCYFRHSYGYNLQGFPNHAHGVCL